jgi:hypothetical protein
LEEQLISSPCDKQGLKFGEANYKHFNHIQGEVCQQLKAEYWRDEEILALKGFMNLDLCMEPKHGQIWMDLWYGNK